MKRIAVLTGGVGGAKLVHGLALAAPDAALTAIVNTGDDFRHFGLHVSPDIDTILYTLSGKANVAQGWGRADETWSFMAAARTLGAADWFNLGDGDLALHVLRTERLNRGDALSAITRDLSDAWGIKARILPMSDSAVATMLDTDEGELEFQRYFVQRRCAPRVSRIWFEGAAGATAGPDVLAAIADADCVLIAPSNPYLSVDPILAVSEIADALRATTAPVVAVSPLVAGAAVKGPTSKLMMELDVDVSNHAIAAHYEPFIDALLVHEDDAAPEGELLIGRANTLMKDDHDRASVAQAALHLGSRIPR